MLVREKFLHPYLSKFDYYLNGSTYVTFNYSMLTQSLLVYHSTRIIVVLYDHHSGKNTNPAQYYCSRN